ncbi:hypothetical protein A3Q56_02735 [Intoshia linei]|uniref:Pre-mRNA-splicing factor CWC25 n=1 Tax=Intoshia linei TaxID=1819745 RepID=A0A177B7W2_9BILA|nr:hypothetical protein A3Q56_02735 [Intoshia linei]
MDEREKIRQLIKERASGISDMNWLYKEKKPNTDDYLFGKNIDDNFEMNKKLENEDDYDENNVDMAQKAIRRTIENDRSTKMREDPLFAIKQQEREAKKKLLQNPIKLKQIKKMLKKKSKSKKLKQEKEEVSVSNVDDLLKSYITKCKKKVDIKKLVNNMALSEDSDDYHKNGEIFIDNHKKNEIDRDNHKRSDRHHDRRNDYTSSSYQQRKTNSDRESKLLEMKNNAVVRQKEREHNYKEHKIELAREEERLKNHFKDDDFDTGVYMQSKFSRNCLLKSVDKLNVEQRIKSSRQHLQRNDSCLDNVNHYRK